MGVPSTLIDGNDVESVYDAASEGYSIARNGKGPFLIEAVTYRWLEHCGPNYDNDIGYRTEAEFLQWKEKDPLVLYRKILKEKSIVTDNECNDWEVQFRNEVRESVSRAKAAPFPDILELSKDEYAS
jgi:pyruvate dehydrogenase E1 component alpha subunit